MGSPLYRLATGAIQSCASTSSSTRQLAGPGEERAGILIILHAIVIRPVNPHPYKDRTKHTGFTRLAGKGGRALMILLAVVMRSLTLLPCKGDTDQARFLPNQA